MDVFNGMIRRLKSRRQAREQYSFELLKSSSAHDFRCRERNLPRFSSQHEQLRLPRGTPATPEPQHVQPQTSYGSTLERPKGPQPMSKARVTPEKEMMLSPMSPVYANERFPCVRKSEEVIDYMGSQMTDVSAMLGFVCNDNLHMDAAPSCSTFNFNFSTEDSNYEKAVGECHAIKESRLFTEGLLLKCIDRKPLFPYLHYAHFTSPEYTERTNEICQVVRDCGITRGSQYGCYDEVYTIQKATFSAENRLPSHRHAGYIVIGFKLLEDQSKQQNLEKTWLQWSGAREIYKYSPRSWNLRRISLLRHPNLYRNGQPRPFVYVLLCEYGSILHPSNTVQALDMCERMRVRNCGHVALYQVHTAYNATQPSSARSPRRKERNPMLRGFSQDVDTTEMRRQKLRSGRDRSFGGYMEEENFDSYPPFEAYGRNLSPHATHAYCD